MKTRVFHAYADPGHAWVKVSRLLLAKLGILGCITHYSYERGAYVYLEEDKDLSTFVTHAKLAGINPIFRTHHTNKQSRIRNYDRFHYDVIDRATCIVIGRDMGAKVISLREVTNG